MPNGRCRLHDGATPRGARHGAFSRGEDTIEAIAERRKSVALSETAAELPFESFRAQTDVAGKLRRGLLQPDDAEAQREVIRSQIATALAKRKKAIELRDAWERRWLMMKRKRRVKSKQRRVAG
jgi:hypothetical protein